MTQKEALKAAQVLAQTHRGQRGVAIVKRWLPDGTTTFEVIDFDHVSTIWPVALKEEQP